MFSPGRFSGKMTVLRTSSCAIKRRLHPSGCPTPVQTCPKQTSARTGVFITMGYKHRTLEERFWSHVRVVTRDDCWEWQAGLDRCGYGMIDQEHAHRVSYRLHYGDFDRDLYVLHKCDNRKCVRPDHLFLGTQLENMRDRKAKGKYNNHGENNPRARLKTEQVIEIRSLLLKGEMKHAEIASLFGVSQYVVADISRGKNWKSVL